MLQLFAEAPEIVTSYGPVGVSAILAGVISWMAKGYRDDMKEALKSNQSALRENQDQFAELLREQAATYATELKTLGESIRSLGCHGAKSLIVAILFLLFMPALFAADPPAIRLPEVQTSAPAPMPAPSADTTVRLTAELLYVIDSDVPVIVLESPRGRITKKVLEGPIRIRGKFVGSTGLHESKTFAGKHVVEIAASHTGPVELLIVPEGAKSESDVKRVSLDVDAGEGPRPPPVEPIKPDVKPDPPKVEPTNPFGDDPTFRVLFVTDNSKALPAEQLAAIYGKSVEEYLTSKSAKVRRYQPNEDGSKDEPAYAKAAKLPRESVPWVFVGKGKRGESVKCPAGPEAMLELLKKYGE